MLIRCGARRLERYNHRNSRWLRGFIFTDAHCALRNTTQGNAENGHLPVVRYLCEGVADPEVCQEIDRACYGACRGGHTEVVKYLVERYPGLIDFPDGDNSAPLWPACIEGHLDLLQFLLSVKPMLINAKNSLGYTLLYIACRHGYLETARFLLQAKPSIIDVNSTDNVSPLEIAKKDGPPRD